MGPLHLFLLLLATGGTCLLQSFLFLTFLEQMAGVWERGGMERDCHGGWSPGTFKCPALTLFSSSPASVLLTYPL